jgi:SAM-dependent methyltransferase
MEYSNALENALRIGAQMLEKNDLEFYKRVWKTPLAVYRDRLRAIGFEGMDTVLDAGSGIGQWTLCLSELNRKVYAVDISAVRVQVVQTILRELAIGNSDVEQYSIDATPYPDNFFDGVFCYGVIMFTDFRRTVREFYRILKPGGRVYTMNCGLGCYLYVMLEQPNASGTYDPRRTAIDTFSATLDVLWGKQHPPGAQIIIPSDILAKEMCKAGFGDLQVAAEGTLSVQPHIHAQSFYPPHQYSLENVYEILGRKP